MIKTSNCLYCLVDERNKPCLKKLYSSTTRLLPDINKSYLVC